MRVWMAVTNDKYEFPIQIANSAQELAKLLNVKINTIYKYKRTEGNKLRVNKDYKIIPVDIPEDDCE